MEFAVLSSYQRLLCIALGVLLLTKGRGWELALALQAGHVFCTQFRVLTRKRVYWSFKTWDSLQSRAGAGPASRNNWQAEWQNATQAPLILRGTSPVSEQKGLHKGIPHRATMLPDTKAYTRLYRTGFPYTHQPCLSMQGTHRASQNDIRLQGQSTPSPGTRTHLCLSSLITFSP